MLHSGPAGWMLLSQSPMGVVPKAVLLKPKGYELFLRDLSAAYGFLRTRIATPRYRSNTTSMGTKSQL